MKLIIIDGGPASGKNTLGGMLVEELSSSGEKVILLDLDSFVEKYNPEWVWVSEEQKTHDQSQAQQDFALNIDKYIQNDFSVIAIGERILSQQDLITFAKRLETHPHIYLYHLNVPFSIRKERLIKRGPHTQINLEADQAARDNVTTWPGHIYENINTTLVDAKNLLDLINSGAGYITDI